MIESILPAVIAALASVAVVCYTQHRAKQLAYFQTYFNRKLDAYAAYWAALSEYEKTRTTEARIALTAKLHMVSLFAPEDIYLQVLQLATSLDEHLCPNGELIERLTNAMRRDLDRCRQMNFSVAEYHYDEGGKTHK